MKKFLLATVLLSSSVAMAQTTAPLNPGFEGWTGLLSPTPNNYATTSDLIESFVGVPVQGDWVTRSTDKTEGLYSIKLMTDSAEIPGFGTFTIPGFIFGYETAQFDFDQLGFSWTDTLKRPVELKGSYKSTVLGQDTVSVFIQASYFDQDFQERVVIGGGAFQATASKSTFTPFTIDIQYEFEIIPDTITIIGATGSFGGGDPQTGTSLWLDNFSYKLATIDSDTTDTTTSIKNVLLANTSVYPNPTVDVVNVKMKESVTSAATVSVYDVIGRRSFNRTFTVSNNEIRFDASDLQDGFYVISIKENGKLFTSSFLKK